jgi:hypothetical protein
MMLEDGDLDAAVEAGLIDHNLRAWLEAFAAERRRAPEPLRRHPSAPRPARFAASAGSSSLRSI